MKNLKIPMLASLMLLAACKIQVATQVAPQAHASVSRPIDVDGKLYAAVYQQRAAEYKALCQQAFNVAADRLDAIVKEKHAKPLAIVSDIDETLLDNSPYAVEMARAGKTYDAKSWLEWTSKAAAEPLAGSVAFCKYAQKKGVEMYYITNRSVQDKPGTLANMQAAGFPFADDAHIVIRENAASKEPRRQKLSETHEIVLLMGDNLADFSAAFDKKDEVSRLGATLDNAAQFGRKFIVLPNPVYGDWEAAILSGNYGRTDAQRDSIYFNKAKGY